MLKKAARISPLEVKLSALRCCSFSLRNKYDHFHCINRFFLKIEQNYAISDIRKRQDNFGCVI